LCFVICVSVCSPCGFCCRIQKMVGRLHVILLSVVPTGAALVYLLWMFGWKKAKGTRSYHCQKRQVVEVTLEQSHDNCDATVSSNSEQCLSAVNNEEDSPAENDVSSVISASDDVSISHGSSFTDVKSPCREEPVSANMVACEQSCESTVDVTSIGLGQSIADKADTTLEREHYETISADDQGDNIADKDEILKCPVIDSLENNTVAFVEDENCYNSCISNGIDNGNETTSDSGCAANSVLSERCENGRRDSMGSVSKFLCL